MKGSVGPCKQEKEQTYNLFDTNALGFDVNASMALFKRACILHAILFVPVAHI